jgi:hypothetical protein
MIPLWKEKNSIYFGVIRSKVKVIVAINRIVNNRIVSAQVLYIGSLPNLATWFPCGRGRTLFILESLTNIGSIDDDELAVKWVGSCITFTNPFTDNTSLT